MFVIAFIGDGAVGDDGGHALYQLTTGAQKPARVAQAAGLQQGDFITSVNGQAIQREPDLLDAIGAAAGQKASLMSLS